MVPIIVIKNAEIQFYINISSTQSHDNVEGVCCWETPKNISEWSGNSVGGSRWVWGTAVWNTSGVPVTMTGV